MKTTTVRAHSRSRKGKGNTSVRSHSRKSTKASRRKMDIALGKKDSRGLLKGGAALRRGRELNKVGTEHPNKAMENINVREDVGPRIANRYLFEAGKKELRKTRARIAQAKAHGAYMERNQVPRKKRNKGGVNVGRSKKAQ